MTRHVDGHQDGRLFGRRRRQFVVGRCVDLGRRILVRLGVESERVANRFRRVADLKEISKEPARHSNGSRAIDGCRGYRDLRSLVLARGS